MKRHSPVPLTLAGVVCFLALAGFAAPWSAEEDPAVRLERAIQLETVDGDLEVAIGQYEQIIEGDGNHRSLVARALLRLGGCYEKLGRREAGKVYRRLVDDYADQVQEVGLARQRLAALRQEDLANVSVPRFRRIRIPGKPSRRAGAMLSPDGTRFAFVAEGGVWVVPLSGAVHPDIAGEPIRLTKDLGAWDNGNMTLDWSRDGQWIGFRGEPESSVYLVPSGGGEPRIVEGSSQGQRARMSVSPDGQTVALSRWREDRSLIFTLPVAEGEPALLNGEPGVYPALSPDGKLIAYVPTSYSKDRALMPRKTSQVKIAPVHGGPATVVFESEGRPLAPTWSPDGGMIAFPLWSGRGEATRNDICFVPVSPEGQPQGKPTRISLENLVVTTLNDEPARKFVNHLGGWSRRNVIALLLDTPMDETIYTVPASGGRATRVALTGREPRWSPDGSRIYFRGETLGGQIASVPAGGGEERPVPIQGEYPGAELTVAFPPGSNEVSPDGRRIVFTGFYRDSEEAPGEAPGGALIFTVPSEGGEARALTDPEEGNAGNPCWSPDGKRIAYTREGSQEEVDIWLVPSQGGAAKRLTSDADRVAAAEIAWSPDGKTIAYFGQDDTIRSIPAAGGTSRVVTAVSVVNYFLGLSWAPDGARLAYTNLKQVLVVSASGGEPEVVPTGFAGVIAQLDWSPDGQTFAFSGVTGGEEEVWLMSDFLDLVKTEGRVR